MRSSHRHAVQRGLVAAVAREIKSFLEPEGVQGALIPELESHLTAKLAADEHEDAEPFIVPPFVLGNFAWCLAPGGRERLEKQLLEKPAEPADWALLEPRQPAPKADEPGPRERIMFAGKFWSSPHVTKRARKEKERLKDEAAAEKTELPIDVFDRVSLCRAEECGGSHSIGSLNYLECSQLSPPPPPPPRSSFLRADFGW